MENLPTELKDIIFKTVQKPKAWLFVVATLFASQKSDIPEIFEIVAGLCAAWIVIITVLTS